MKIGKWQITTRTALMILAVLAYFLVAYFLIVPAVLAERYFSDVRGKAAQAKASLTAVSTGSNVVVFEDPDIPLDKRQALIAQTLANVQKAQASLSELQNANKLPRLPGDGLTGEYRKAIVREERTDNAVRQSHEVLNGYANALSYIKTYTEIQQYLAERLRLVNSISDFNALTGQGSGMGTVAANLQADYDRLAALTPPPDFAPLHSEALQTLSQAADSFGRLAAGLNRSSDAEIYGAVAALEQLTDKNEVTDSQMMTTLAETSPTLLQLAELPEKIEYIQQR